MIFKGVIEKEVTDAFVELFGEGYLSDINIRCSYMGNWGTKENFVDYIIRQSCRDIDSFLDIKNNIVIDYEASWEKLKDRYKQVNGIVFDSTAVQSGE
jgi:hypothetical protein